MGDYICCAIDLNYLEETAGGPNLTLALLPKSNKIVLVQVNDSASIVGHQMATHEHHHFTHWDYEGPKN